MASNPACAEIDWDLVDIALERESTPPSDFMTFFQLLKNENIISVATLRANYANLKDSFDKWKKRLPSTPPPETSSQRTALRPLNTSCHPRRAESKRTSSFVINKESQVDPSAISLFLPTTGRWAFVNTRQIDHGLSYIRHSTMKNKGILPDEGSSTVVISWKAQEAQAWPASHPHWDCHTAPDTCCTIVDDEWAREIGMDCDVLFGNLCMAEVSEQREAAGERNPVASIPGSNPAPFDGSPMLRSSSSLSSVSNPAPSERAAFSGPGAMQQSRQPGRGEWSDPAPAVSHHYHNAIIYQFSGHPSQPLHHPSDRPWGGG